MIPTAFVPFRALILEINGIDSVEEALAGYVRGEALTLLDLTDTYGGELNGAVTTDPAAEGTVTADVNVAMINEAWTGGFSDETLSGSFGGSFGYKTFSFNFTGEFDATRN